MVKNLDDVPPKLATVNELGTVLYELFGLVVLITSPMSNNNSKSVVLILVYLKCCAWNQYTVTMAVT